MAKDSYRAQRDRSPAGCCPACGQHVPAEADLRVDLQTNTLSANGSILVVQPRTAELVELLLQRAPNFVPRDVIVSRIWADEAVERTVDAQASRARASLKKLGYTLEGIRHSGYRVFRDRSATAPVGPAVASLSRLQYTRPF